MSEAHAVYTVAAALLRAGRWIAAYSLLLSALAVAGLLWRPVLAPAWLAVLLLGALQIACAVRVEFDARLFEKMASGTSIAALDRALVEVAGMPAIKAGRPAAARVQGARRCLRWQMGAAAAQTVVVLVAGGVVWFRWV
jgi:hypothetical protein